MLFALAVLLVAGFESNPDLKKGQALIEEFEYEQAAVVFEALSKKPGLADRDRGVALVWLGLSLAELRQQSKAAAAFEDAVEANPSVSLPRDVSPKIKALLEDARGRVRARVKATSPPPRPPKPKPPKRAAVTTAPVVADPPPEPEPPPPPAPSAPSPSNLVAPSEAPPAPEPGPEQEGPLLPIALGAAIAGGVVGLAGGAVWGVGLMLHDEALREPFQSEAAVLRERSVASQIAGRVVAGVGVAALAVGGVLLGVSSAE
jgi:hypothetical protein